MNILVPLVISLPLLIGAYLIYAKYIDRLFKKDDSRPTPACEFCDDVDFVPTKPFVLFGHHFASIAGGGPIIGPTLALLYGYLPVWLWVLLGSVFIGAVHDMTALFTSVREKGRSIAETATATLGRTGTFLFLGFTIIMLLMVTSVFLKLTAASLTSLVPVSALEVPVGNLPVRMVVDGGVEKFVIGGIATTTVFVITLFAPLIGYLLYKRNISVWLASLLCITVGVGGVVVGLHYPVQISPGAWMIILSIYTIFAAGIPVWLVLQPRDFTNVFLLYGGMAILLIGSISAGFQGATFTAPALNVTQGSSTIGPLFPLLFITVACGAISGFHSLVAGGTSAKQIRRESDIRTVAYGGMVLEGLLALLVMIAVASGFDFTHYVNIVHPAKNGNPILGFAMGMGGLIQKGLGINPILGAVFGILMVEGFVVTTLDTAVRLNRYLFEELWAVLFKQVPRLMKSYLFNACLCVAMMYGLARTNTIMDLWKIFGSANQLLAALTLIAVAAWMYLRSMKNWVAVWPAVFMLITAIVALVWVLFKSYIPLGNWILCAADVLLLALAIGVVSLCVKFLRQHRQAKAAAR